MLGDTAVAVNPRDERYKKLVGRKVLLPIQNREIPIVTDEAVEKEFGTGAVKVTPAHDAVDFDISQRHKLEIREVIDKEGKMTELAGQEFAGLSVVEARRKVLAKLKELGLIKKDEPYKHSVALCYKCGSVIEPMVSEQWFVKIKPLAEKAIKAVRGGEIKFHPKRFERIFFNWMRNIRDWNISRQIVWGIRIPVWYCVAERSGAKSAEVTRSGTKADSPQCFVISDTKPTKCSKCGATKFIPENDTFDTWFSSGQWPYATLQTTRKGDFERFYPTSVMETGWDIIFFWVARMIMMGIYSTGKIPFKDVVLHGLVRDKDRQKMSKSKGNVIDPMVVADAYGADALRMALVFNTSLGFDVMISEDKILTQKKFANKIWNAARFSLQNFNKNFNPKKVKPDYTKKDRWILAELEKTSEKTKKDLENYKFHEAAQKIYHFFWHKFCDKCIEDVKTRIKEPKSEKDKKIAQLILWTVLVESLKLLHPFMPFITEAIYQEIPHRPQKALIIENWPLR
jgi:valyl-tRNA synthetase